MSLTTIPLVISSPSLTHTATASLQHRFFKAVDEAGMEWDAAAPDDNLFLQRAYLRVLEECPPEGMRFGYLVFYLENRPVGVAVCQIKYFKGDDNIAELDTPIRETCFFKGLAQWFKKWVAGKTAADILICGNMLLTGEHGFYFNLQRVTNSQAITALEKALDEVVDIMGDAGIRMPVILLKDLSPEQREQEGQYLTQKGYTEFDIQPNMVLDLPYDSFDSYLGSMSTKYRTRAKRAFKKLDGIEKRELTAADIERELPRIYELYRDIAKNAGFNMVDLNERYLLALKQHLPERFRLFAYYLDGKMIAFYTTICNHREMEAHFIGYDKHFNHDYQLYLNSLYDMARMAIDAKCTRIIYARTALEIKSSIGATPHDLWCYLRHQNSLLNRFAGSILDYLKPVEQWTPRHPFKHEES